MYCMLEKGCKLIVLNANSFDLTQWSIDMSNQVNQLGQHNGFVYKYSQINVYHAI